MNNYRQEILDNLREILNRQVNAIHWPCLYLDPEGAWHIYRELSGWSSAPEIQPFDLTKEKAGTADTIALLAPQGEVTHYFIFEAMAPIIQRLVPLAKEAGDIDPARRRFARIQGQLQTTRFPDGNLNLQITFANIRGLLFFTPGFFNSMFRPLLNDDRFYDLSRPVEALVYMHDRIKKTIFYHPIHGDDIEHQWMPVVPVAIRDMNEA
jgi:hypothetical protein